MTAITLPLDRMKRWLSSGSFASHVMAVSGSAFIGQAVSIVVGPINSRLYRPMDYGTLTVFAAMFSLMSVLGSMQYEMSLATADDDNEAIHLLLVCVILLGIWSTIFVLVTVAWGGGVARMLSKDDSQLYKFLWYLPLGIWFTSMTQILSRWAMRKKAFPRLSYVQIVTGILASVCTVGLGIFHAGLPGLVTGSVVANAYCVWCLGRLAWPDFTAQRLNLSLEKLKAAAFRYYRYPLYTTWSTLMNTMSGLIPVFFLTRGFGAAYTGYFSLCSRILYLPTLLVSGAITPVFYSRAKEAQLAGNLTTLTTRLINSITGVNVFFAVFLGMFGERLFVLVFGPQWHRSGQYAAALAPWFLCQFLVNPLEALPLVYNRQRGAFIFQIILLFLRVGSLSVGVMLHNDLLAMWMFGGASAVFMLVYFSWLLHLVDGPVGEVLLKLGKELLLALAAFGACRWVMYASHDNLWVTGVALVPVLGIFSYRGVRQILTGRVEA